MERYADVDGASGVAAFEIGGSYILVEFKDGSVYEYTTLSAGRVNIDYMARLAREGNGLNSFINTNVKKRYSRKAR